MACLRAPCHCVAPSWPAIFFRLIARICTSIAIAVRQPLRRACRHACAKLASSEEPNASGRRLRMGAQEDYRGTLATTGEELVNILSRRKMLATAAAFAPTLAFGQEVKPQFGTPPSVISQ